MRDSYWRRVCCQALLEARQTLGLEVGPRLGWRGIVFAAIIFFLAFWGSADASRDEIVVRIGAAAAMAGLFPIVYIWKLIRIPPKLEIEATIKNDKQIMELNNQNQNLRESMQPKIVFTGEIQREKSRLKPEQENVWLIVENAGSSILERCLVKAEYLTLKNGDRSEVQLGLLTDRRDASGKPGRFALAGGERKRILFMRRDPTNISLPENYRIPFENGDCILSWDDTFVVELAATADVGLPDRTIINLSCDAAGHMEINLVTA